MSDKPADNRISQAYERAIKALEPIDLTIQQAEVVVNVLNDLGNVIVDVTAEGIVQSFKDESRVQQGVALTALTMAYAELAEAKEDILRLLDEAEGMDLCIHGDRGVGPYEPDELLTEIAGKYR